MLILFRKTARIALFAVFGLLGAYTVQAQNDSTLLLKPEWLGNENINLNIPDYQYEVYSATRSTENPEDLPFQVWVITAEEILHNGFITLADVLKAAPGIRVSQPGNPLEGETFLMRGLSGNQYVKIMINDVPVKPGMALGMPIGAQLPIRQAERIEVVFGPASAQYGNEACAGVVNIIMKEVDRPVYAQADLSFGNNGFNSLDMMFGGKLGKDKNILQYSIFGSSTVREQPDLFFDDGLYNMNSYLMFGLDESAYQSNPNYAASTDSSQYPRKSPLSMESRSFGGQVRWRGMEFAYYRMARQEHAALGQNPFALSYSNASNSLSERIETFAFTYKRQQERRQATHLLSVQRYRISNTSTVFHIFDRFNWMAYEASLPLTSNDDDRRQLFETTQSRFSEGVRYGVADALDIRLETRHRMKLNKHLHLELAGQLGTGVGSPLNTFYSQPLDLKVKIEQIDTKPFNLRDTGWVDVHTYGQLHYHGERLTVVGGVNIGLLPTAVLAPRLGIQYRFDSSWAVWANGSGGYRQPAVYTNMNSLVYDPYRIEGRLNSGNLKKAERVYAGELGIRYRNANFRADLSGFVQESYDLVRDGRVYDPADAGINDSLLVLGFEQPEGLAQRIWGVQMLMRIPGFDLEGKRNRLNSNFEFFMQRTGGMEWAGDVLPTIDAPLNAPLWMAQFRMFLRSDNSELVIASNRQREALSKSVLYRDRVQRQAGKDEYDTFRTWDVTLRFYLSKNFVMYLMVQNVFGREYTGLDATGTPDDLLYPVQQRRQVRLGVNYSMR